MAIIGPLNPFDLSISHVFVLVAIIALSYLILSGSAKTNQTGTEGDDRTGSPATRGSEGNMSRLIPGNKAKENAMIAELREITGATLPDAAKLAKKHKTLEGAIEAFYSDLGMQSRVASAQGDKQREKKLGEIWERFKDSSDPKLIKIDGTLQLCEELDIDPENDVVLFCLAHELGSKVTGEWEKGPWISGWAALPGGIDSLEGMKNALPALRDKVYKDPAYFKKVYLHTFDLAKAPGARTLALDNAISLWQAYIPKVLSSTPSALSHIPQGAPPSAPSTEPPQFSEADFDLWIEFQQKKGKAISKDTWSLFVDFVRSIDREFKEYDEEAAWPSTIDDFVEHVRASRKT